MALKTDEVRQVARLARLSLEPGEIEELARELASILDHMRDLGHAELEGVPAMGGISDHAAPMRADEVGADRLRLPLVQLAPVMEESLFLVPRLAALDADALAESQAS